MSLFAIDIKKTSSRTVLIKADDLDSALERVEHLYNKGDIAVDEVDEVDVIPSPYADQNGKFCGTKREMSSYLTIK